MSCREPDCDCLRFVPTSSSPTTCLCHHSCVRHRVARPKSHSSGAVLIPDQEISSSSQRQRLQRDLSLHLRIDPDDSSGADDEQTFEVFDVEFQSPTSAPASTPKPVQGDFARSLPAAFDSVKSQLQTGMAEVYRLKQFVMKLCQLEQEFAAEIGALVRSEKKKISAWRKPDFMVACGGAVLDLFEQADLMAQGHAWFASEARLSVVEPLQTFEEIANPILSRIVDKEKGITQAMDARRQTMEKKRQECARLLHLYGGEVGLDDSSSSSVEPSPSSRPSSMRSGKLLQKLGTKVLGKAEDSRTRRNLALIQKTCASYSDEVESSNQLLHMYASGEVPSLLVEMQSLEEMRINSIRGHVEAFGRLFVPMSRRYEGIFEQLAKSCSMIDVAQDIQGFCANTASHFARGSQRLEPFRYDLHVPLEKINRAISVADDQFCVFKTALSSIMERQELFPHHSLPNIFTILKAALIRAGGMRTEGVFRVSPDASLVVELARQLDSGDLYIAPPVDVAAALLKKWMRELTTPIIPDDTIYERCVSLGSSPIAPTPSQLDDLLDDIPPINARLLAAVVHLIRQFAKHQSQTRMSSSSLCIVLVPSILRCPESVTPAQMIKNSQHESKFLEYCVASLNTIDKWKYPQEEEDDALRFLSRPRPSQPSTPTNDHTGCPSGATSLSASPLR